MKRLRYCPLLIVILLAQLLLSQTQPPPKGQGSSTNNQTTQQTKPSCTDNGTYTNSKGKDVKQPESCSSAPQGATAQCRDGTYSFSQSRRGTCSHHGGVAKWL